MHPGETTAGSAGNAGAWQRNRWRTGAWTGAALVLLLPLAAMLLTDEVNWDPADFAVFGAMLLAAGGTFEAAARTTANTAYRAATGIALATAFVLVWMNLAVGIIGTEDNPANGLFGGVLAVGFIGAVVARFRPAGMARTLAATAVAQASVAAIALIAGSDIIGPTRPAGILMPTGLFVAPWLMAAWLFRKAAREQAAATAAS